MIEVTILNTEFDTDQTTVISNINEAYVVEESDSTSTYIAFSATSVCSVVLYYNEECEGYLSYKVVELTNPDNISNLYALCLTLDKNNQTHRTSNFMMTINCCSGIISKTTEFSIIQKACIYTVKFDWGIYDHYNFASYNVGDEITTDGIEYTLQDLVEDGFGWDGKFYYDQEFTQEVYFDSDIPNRDITIYANVFRVMRFDVLDGASQLPIDNAEIEINSSPATVLNCPEYTDYAYVVAAPYESTTQMFSIVVSKENYNDGGGSYSIEMLDRNALTLEGLHGQDEFTITSQWFPPFEERDGSCVDFDSHLQILDSNMDPINEDNVPGFTTESAHLCYSSHDGDETWAENSGYNAWLSGRTMACAVIKRDGIFYELDYDYTGGTSREPVEHISGKVNLNSNDRIYRFILDDCSECGKLHEYGAKVNIVFGNVTHRFDVPVGNSTYWTVFDIKKVNGTWTVVPVNTLDDNRPSWFIGCPS